MTPIAALTIVLAVVVGFSGIWIPGVIHLRRRQQEGRFARMQRERGAGPIGEREMEVEVCGRRVVVALHPPTRSTPWQLEVSVPSGMSFGFGASVWLRPERWIDRLGKRLGINREVQIGDPPFDRAVYIESRAPDVEVRRLLSTSGKRAAIMTLLALGFSRIALRTERALVSVVVEPRRAHFTGAVMEQATAAVLVLTEGLTEPADASGAGRKHDILRGGLGALGGLAFICFFVLGGWSALRSAARAYVPLDNRAVIVGVIAGLCVAIAGVPITALAVRGRSNSFGTLGRLTLAFVVGLPGWSATAVVTANAVFDDSAPHVVRSSIASSTISTGKGGGPDIEIAPFESGGAALKLRVDESIYERFRRGDEIELTIGDGALGCRWLRGFDHVKQP